MCDVRDVGPFQCCGQCHFLVSMTMLFLLLLFSMTLLLLLWVVVVGAAAAADIHCANLEVNGQLAGVKMGQNYVKNAKRQMRPPAVVTQSPPSPNSELFGASK